MLTTGSRQFVEQRLRFFQIGGVEALGEQALSRRKEIVSFGDFALVLPTSEVAGDTRARLPCRADRLPATEPERP